MIVNKNEKMKNIIIIITFLLSVYNLKGQTYVQGNGALPFKSIANTSVLTDAIRLNMNEAFQKYNEYGLNVSNKTNSSKLVGEYYFQNNLLIQLVSGNKIATQDELTIEEMVDYYREVYTQNIYENEEYFVGEVLVKNNFKGFVYYDKRDTSINFSLRDNAGKYLIKGRITFKSNNLTNARAFFDSFINSISFK